MRLFVYGTLMRGGPNSSLLSFSSFVRKAKTLDSFYLVANETTRPPHESYKYPYLLRDRVHPSQQPVRVAGEVWELRDEDESTLAKLDELEGHPEHYRRQSILIDDGSECQIYILENTATIAEIKSSLAAEESDKFKIVGGGCWREYSRDFA